VRSVSFLKDLRDARETYAALQQRTIPADPVEFVRRFVGIEPDPWQERVLRKGAIPGAQTILNCSRQVGKSTTSAALALHTALTEPGSLVLIVAPAQRQALETFGTAARMYRAVGEPVPSDSYRKMGMELKNGSRIEALPGTPKTIRGFASVRLLILDEASQIPDELYHAVRPMLAVSGGALLLASTPYDTTGIFHDAWMHGEGWHKEAIPATECPRIPIEFLESERAAMPDRIFRREYLCEFVGADDRVWSEELIEAIANDELEMMEI
jgi:Terminase large subunit, T4likevirus-type, N-terminal